MALRYLSEVIACLLIVNLIDDLCCVNSRVLDHIVEMVLQSSDLGVVLILILNRLVVET